MTPGYFFGFPHKYPRETFNETGLPGRAKWALQQSAGVSWAPSSGSPIQECGKAEPREPARVGCFSVWKIMLPLTGNVSPWGQESIPSHKKKLHILKSHQKTRYHMWVSSHLSLWGAKPECVPKTGPPLTAQLASFMRWGRCQSTVPSGRAGAGFPSWGLETSMLDSRKSWEHYSSISDTETEGTRAWSSLLRPKCVPNPQCKSSVSSPDTN